MLYIYVIDIYVYYVLYFYYQNCHLGDMYIIYIYIHTPFLDTPIWIGKRYQCKCLLGSETQTRVLRQAARSRSIFLASRQTLWGGWWTIIESGGVNRAWIQSPHGSLQISSDASWSVLLLAAFIGIVSQVSFPSASNARLLLQCLQPLGQSRLWQWNIPHLAGTDCFKDFQLDRDAKLEDSAKETQVCTVQNLITNLTNLADFKH